MSTSGKTVLITGGTSGIGLALAERFYKAGYKVIICGQREKKQAPKTYKEEDHARRKQRME